MGGLTSAVDWWEESQLRVLVLTSMAIQLFLISFPVLRRMAIPGWFRFILWLVYHGGDAVAIYGLATLFNRHKDQGDVVGGGRNTNTLLEVVWAPVLLIHLGGNDGVTAYNIEDNELWTRHLLIAVSQVTVAVYVFCKSWPPGGEKRLLAAAILLFVVGVVKCFFKAWAFKRASIYSLVRSNDTAANQTNSDSMYNELDKYVKNARNIVIRQQPELDHHHQVMEEEDPGTAPTLSVEVMKQLALLRQEEERLFEERGEAFKLFVDLSSSYDPHRINIFKKFWELSEERAYDSVQGGLANAFFLLYTKLKTVVVSPEDTYYKSTGNELESWEEVISKCLYVLRALLPWATFSLFYYSHREAYSGIDVKVTYAILCCTAVLEFYSFMIVSAVVAWTVGPRHNNESSRERSLEVWPETVAQYSLAGYFVRNKKHSTMMRIVSLLQCKDFLDQHWCMEPCFTSARITCLVLGYLRDGWKEKIQDVDSYRSFNNHWFLNMNRPFDECVLLLHLATDFCFFSTSFPDHTCAFAKPPTKKPPASRPQSQCSQESVKCKAVQCRQMSNYMVYLLFVNPEMLLPGSRRNLFKTAYDELKGILKDMEWNPVCWSRCTPCGVKLMKEEAVVMEELNKRMKEKAVVTEIAITVMQQKAERTSQEGSSMKGSNRDESFIHKAWDLAQELLKKDEMEMWEEIQDVWVQMLCFSASRCRGYLHAKALGKGGEFLSYVWLLLFYMGMETFSERLQRELFPRSQADKGTLTDPPPTSMCRGSCSQRKFHKGTYPPPNSEVSTSTGTPPASEVQTCDGTGNTPSTSEICMAEDSMG